MNPLWIINIDLIFFGKTGIVALDFGPVTIIQGNRPVS
jgi:hypothetical protein